MNQKRNVWDLVICSFVIGWTFVYILLGNPMSSFGLESTKTQNVVLTIGLIAIVTLVALRLGKEKKHLLHIVTISMVFVAEVFTLLKQSSEIEILGFAMVIGAVIYFFREDVVFVIDKISISDKSVKVIFISFALLLFMFLASVGCLRYILYFSEGHDLGIFTQMYEYMIDTGGQLTTIERNELMSHFSVHVSPIYYVLLPIYFLFPSAMTLQVCQAALVALSLLPLYLLCNHFALGNKTKVAICILYTCYPALSGSCFNDFHENAFVPILLLTLIYAVEKNKNILFFISMFAALSVKEDVALQLAVLAMYFIVSRKNMKKGVTMLCTSFAYLIFALWILSHGYEEGVLGYMNNMYLTSEGGIFEVVQVILMNPGYMLRQCFSSMEKILYLGWVFIPIILALGVKKNCARYIPLIYMVFMNLLPMFNSLTSIRSQYHFPITVFVFYIVIMNFSEWRVEEKKERVSIMLGMTVFLFVVTLVQPAVYYGIETIQNRENISKMNIAINSVPDEASISAASQIIPHIADHKEVYGFYVDKKTDYIIVDYRPKSNADFDRINAWISLDIYEEVFYEPDLVKIYKKKDIQ